MFLLHEKVVYPSYGVAMINRLVERLVGKDTKKFFELKFFNKDMTILIPEDRLESIGVRKVSSRDELHHMFAMLYDFTENDIIREHNASTWNKRNKDYQAKLRTGQLLSLCSIYKELHLINLDKELSFGERNLFNQIESLLLEEIGVIRPDESIEMFREQLRKPFEIMQNDLRLLALSKAISHQNSKDNHMSHKSISRKQSHQALV